MAKAAKKLADIKVGDTYMVPKLIVEKRETATEWILLFNDNTSMTFDKQSDPALEIGT